MQVWCKTFILNVQFCKTIIRTEYIQYIYSPSKYIKKYNNIWQTQVLFFYFSLYKLSENGKKVSRGAQ